MKPTKLKKMCAPREPGHYWMWLDLIERWNLVELEPINIEHLYRAGHSTYFIKVEEPKIKPKSIWN